MFFVSFWVQKLIHNNSVWIQIFLVQKLIFNISFLIQKLTLWISFWFTPRPAAIFVAAGTYIYSHCLGEEYAILRQLTYLSD